MRLIKFKIGDYRVLRNLTLDFTRDEASPSPQREYAIDFLAGVNGTGKSTALHLLGRLFAWLEVYDYFPVPIELEYELSDKNQITISNLPEAENGVWEPRLRYKINEEAPVTGRKLDEQFLPRHVVMYTTGDEAEWQTLLEEDEQPKSVALGQPDLGDPRTQAKEWYLHELPSRQSVVEVPGEMSESNPEIPDRMLFIQRERLTAVALCGLLASRMRATGEQEVMHRVLQSVEINAFVGFSLRCRIHEGLIQPQQKQVIEDLMKRADRVIVQGADRLLVFDLKKHPTAEGKPVDGDSSIFGLYKTPLQYFQAINALFEHATYQDPPLQEINLFFTRKPKDKSDDDPLLHLWDWLSDGERSFLARMALFTLFKEDDILILLDEPEVHFNDVWKREIVNMLDQIMREHKSHALITTHSSIALTDVPKNHILVLTREGTYTTKAPEPTLQTLGADPSDIMVHVFGTRYATGERSVHFIREEIGKANSKADLEKLKGAIASGYWRYRVQLEIEHFGAAA